MAALIDEAKKHKLGTTAHLGQTGVARMNTIDAARLGLGTQTHFYGLFESMYENNDIQPWPVDMNYSNEQHRFGQVARQVSQVQHLLLLSLHVQAIIYKHIQFQVLFEHYQHEHAYLQIQA